MVLNAGELDKKITIQYEAISRATDGAETITWTDLDTAWARIRPLIGRAREFFGAGQVIAEASIEVTIRYRTALPPKMRFKYGKRIFNILAMQNPEEANIALISACKEVTTYGQG
jgi:SPP1 family predicted phage head-tail adaptor